MDVKKVDDWLKYGPAQFEIISISDDLIRKVIRIKDGITFRLGFTLKHNTFIMDSGVRRIEITYINRFEKDCVVMLVACS
jgi:tetrahydrodipicolinate N-succinyltransferase